MAGPLFPNLGGTTETKFQVAKGGSQFKYISATQMALRNAADSAYAEIQVSKLSVSGSDIDLNAFAAGAGADWKMTLQRPSTGMTAAVTLVLPPTVNPTVGQALSVASVAGGVIGLGYATVPTGTDSPHIDVTALGFGTPSPVPMFNNPTGGMVRVTRVVIDTTFNGTPSLSIGIAGTTSKYMPATAVDLTAAAGTVYEFRSESLPVGSTEAVIATYASGGASAGAARILTDWVIPS